MVKFGGIYQQSNGYGTNKDTQEYKINHWGQTFPGSSIDIYEWTESTSTKRLNIDINVTTVNTGTQFMEIIHNTL